MRSAIVLTEEIDDLDAAVQELADGIREKLTLGAASLGLVYCDSEADVAPLSDMLHRELGIDVIGLTSTALIEREHGYCDIGISLLVMTGDDVEISVGSTDDLTIDGFDGQIRAAYKEARARLSSDPKLIITCAPFITEITSDNYVDILDDMSGHAPVFGGVAGDHYELARHNTFFNGHASSRSLRFAMITGAISPVFALKHHFSTDIKNKKTITESHGNTIDMIGDQTFSEYLASMTSIPDIDDLVFQYQSTPFITELPDFDPSEEPVVRVLLGLDKETGAASFMSNMPVGSRMGVSVLDRDDICISSKKTVELLRERMTAQDGYEFSTVLVTTCNGRHMLMGNDKSIEARALSDGLADLGHLSSMGFYAFGEICPTAARNSTAKNRFHNESFALCAF